MLRHLTIRDFVLVDRLELEFEAGFGTLTGETGAGKSILVDALAFVLGDRADTGLIRTTCERTEVTAEFSLEDAQAVLELLRELDLDGEEGLLLRRVLDSGGRSRAFLNGSPITVQQLREVSGHLVDIHGQHAHQSLLRPETQRQLLDGHAGLTDQVRRVSEAWRQWQEARNALKTASQGTDALEQEREQLQWQTRELETLGLTVEEWGELNSEHKRLAHAASLVEGTRFSLSALAEEEVSCESQLDAALTRLEELSQFDPDLLEMTALLHSAQNDLAEAVSSLRRYADRLELDPDRLDEVERRMDAVLACARKFRSAPEELPSLLVRWQERLAALGEATDMAALEKRVETSRQHYTAQARKLSSERAKAAKQLGNDVSRVMQQLALQGGQFEIALLPLEESNASGLEQAEFRIAGLAGSESRALAKVASGGELSRISLAIQVVASQATSIPSLVFDEVDVGIGGAVAEVVGRLLRELGSERQVLCVTHLPQVAARANWQWQVSKETRDGEAFSRVVALDSEGRVEEVARMLGGVEITAVTRQHAREMLEDS